MSNSLPTFFCIVDAFLIWQTTRPNIENIYLRLCATFRLAFDRKLCCLQFNAKMALL